ncbi:MAG: hypothetical protein KF709_03850 [Gemmatimonadaceae bacterium]|nr:hypothetical protein [Gemmatimonadaceae bacterium]
MIPTQLVWFSWSVAFLVPWALLYWRFPAHRRAMWRSSLLTTPFGLTEPLFVPEYWDPPSLFDLAQRTGFDVESLIFCFGIGGVAAVLVAALTRRTRTAAPAHERTASRHRFHRWALASPFITFVALLPLGWNPIYPGIVAMLVGGVASLLCRPDLARVILLGGVAFVAYYAVFLVGLEASAPADYIRSVWNLQALSGVMIGFIPLEEVLFAFGFGTYWSGIYEHVTWHQLHSAGITPQVATTPEHHAPHDTEGAP